MEGLFIMTMLVDLSDLSITLDELVMGLRKIGEEINMETTLRLAGGPPERKRVAVLVTKEPHCLAQLVQDRDAGVLNGDLVVVLSNHADLEPLAREHKIPFAWAPSTDKAAHEEFLLARLAEHKPDLVVLARYMQILTTRVIDRYPFRIINIHPSLLPYHPGSNAYKQAWEEGVRVSGCTAHFVTEQVDAGPVILQDVFHIRVGEDALAGEGLERRAAFVAGLLVRHGVAVVIALPVAARAMRERVRAELGRMIEVYARPAHESAGTTYEPPERPEVEITVPEPAPGAGVEQALRTLEVLDLLPRGEEPAYSEEEEREVIRRLKAFGYL